MSATVVDSENCGCELCSTCDGSGRVWLTWSGRYRGKYRVSELDIRPRQRKSFAITSANCGRKRRGRG